MASGFPYLGAAVVFAEPDAPQIPFNAIGPSISAVVAARDAGRIVLHIVDGASGQRREVHLLSLDICAAIAVTAAGEDLLRDLAQEIGADGGATQGFPPIARISPDGDFRAQFGVAAQEGLAWLIRSIAGRNAALASALAAVRGEHEVLQNAVASLEEVVLAGHLPEKPAFTLAPTDRVLHVREQMSAGVAVTQRIPVSSRGVSSIDLCFFVSDDSSKGQFEVSLQTLEDGAEVGRWRVPFQRIGAGWTRLQLDQALMGQPRTLQISITADARDGTAPDIVLAAPSPLEDAVYKTSTGQTGDCPLAFRIWRSLPGLRSRAALGALQTAAPDGDRSSLRHLPADQLSFAEPFGRGTANAAELVRYIQDEGELQVHPAARGLVAACLRGAIPPFARRVSASVITRHAEADMLDYALLAISGSAASESLLARIAGAREPFDGFSGWTAVPPMEQSQVSLTFERPPRAAMDLVLITRVHARDLTPGLVWRNLLSGRLGRGHARYAWARFFDVEVELSQQ